MSIVRLPTTNGPRRALIVRALSGGSERADLALFQATVLVRTYGRLDNAVDAVNGDSDDARCPKRILAISLDQQVLYEAR